MPARLIAVRLPPEPVGRARRRARKSSHKAGDRIQPGTLVAAGFVLLLTSLDPHAYPAERVAGLYRLRWQVELAFKRLKSLLRLDRLPAKDPQLARAWLSAHLIGALLIEDLIRDEVPDSPPWGPGSLAAQRVAVAAGGPVRRGPRGGRARPGLPQAAA